MKQFLKLLAPATILIATAGCKTTSEPSSGTLLDCKERVTASAQARWKWNAKSKAKNNWKASVSSTVAPGYSKWKNSVSRQQSESKNGTGSTKWTAIASAVPCAKK